MTKEGRKEGDEGREEGWMDVKDIKEGRKGMVTKGERKVTKEGRKKGRVSRIPRKEGRTEGWKEGDEGRKEG